MQDFIERRMGMHITEYKHIDFDWYIENSIGFMVTSQFDGDSLKRAKIALEPNCGTGQILWAAMSDDDNNAVEYHKILMKIDSSD